MLGSASPALVLCRCDPLSAGKGEEDGVRTGPRDFFLVAGERLAVLV